MLCARVNLLSCLCIDFRHSDRQRLAPSVRNYDRVILPLHILSSSQLQHQSGAAKIRPGRRGSRLPSSSEVFAVQTPPATDDNSSPFPNGSMDQTSIGVRPSTSSTVPKSETDNGGRGPGKHSSKKDKSNAARCLRGRPSELQKPYFVVEDDNGAGANGEKTSLNDPFWDVSEARSTPRRPSIVEAQSTSFFKPSTSTENVASMSDGVPGSSTSDVQMCYVLLPSGNIGTSSTDTDVQSPV